MRHQLALGAARYLPVKGEDPGIETVAREARVNTGGEVARATPKRVVYIAHDFHTVVVRVLTFGPFRLLSHMHQDLSPHFVVASGYVFVYELVEVVVVPPAVHSVLQDGKLLPPGREEDFPHQPDEYTSRDRAHMPRHHLQ